MSAFDSSTSAAAGAIKGEVKIFQSGKIAPGYTQISGEPANYGSSQFVVCNRPFQYTDWFRLARASDGVHAVWAMTGARQAGHAVYDEVNNVWLPRTVSASWTNAYPYNSNYGVGAFVGLPDGRIFHSSMPTQTYASIASIFDPATNGWTDVAPPPAPISQYSGCLLTDGRVLLAGGRLQSGYAYAYNTKTNTWETFAGPNNPNIPTIVSLPSGKALLILDSTYSVFTPSTNSFTPYAPLPALTCDFGIGGAMMPTATGALVLTNGTGNDTNQGGALVYTEATDKWVSSSSILTPFTGSRAGAMAQLNSGAWMFVTNAAAPIPSFMKYLSQYSPVSLVQATKD